MGLDTAGNGIDIVAVSNTPGGSETFQIVKNPDDSKRVRIKAPNGFFLQVIGFLILAMNICLWNMHTR